MPMSAAGVLIGILGALLIGAISPGPSFVLVSRISLSMSRRHALAAAFGMGCGGAVFGALALLGLSALLSQVAWLYSVLKLSGGAYLIYLGIRIWRGALDPHVISNADAIETISPARSFSLAFLTQISNPKTAVVYGSVFAALLPPVPPIWMLLVLSPLILIVETSWYALVALLFSAGGPRSIYLGCKHWIDRTAGAIMGTLGVKLIFEITKSR